DAAPPRNRRRHRADRRQAGCRPAGGRPARQRPEFPRPRGAACHAERRAVIVSDELLDDCGCCAGVTTATEAPGNRPGLSAVAFRVGTHADFKQAMQAALSDADRPALAPLTTRDVDDFAIALIDAWATVADVLTFYQERIANESYLRTATEMRSVLE